MKKISSLIILICLTVIAFAQNGVQEFTESGTFIVPAGVTSLTIEVVGAGGSGGGNGAGGGGGGGYATGVYTVQPLQQLLVTVGVGGGAQNTGTTSVGNLIKATGGAVGSTVPNPNIGGGGNGGKGSGGTISNYSGGKGGGGYYTYFGGGGAGAAGVNGDGENGGNTIVWDGQNCLTPGGAGGLSGGEPGGNGGKGAGFIDDFCSVSDPSQGGFNYGGGGGGANGNGGAAGNGAGGYCLITWDYATGLEAVTSNAASVVQANIFTDFIQINKNAKVTSYQLADAVGHLIWEGSAIESQNFSALSSGVYFLRVAQESSFQTIKLIKE